MIDVLNVIFNYYPDRKINYITISKIIKLHINHDSIEAVMNGDLYTLLHIKYDYKKVLYHSLIHKHMPIVQYIIHKHELVIGNYNTKGEYFNSKDRYLYEDDILIAIGYCGDEILIRKICCVGFFYTALYIKKGILQDNNHDLLKKLSNLYYFT